MPNSLQAQITRRAISPRLATSILLNIVSGDALLLAARPDAEQWLPILHGLPVIHKDAQHFAADVGFDLVHELHRFHDAKRRARVHMAANLHKRLRARARRT